MSIGFEETIQPPERIDRETLTYVARRLGALGLYFQLAPNLTEGEADVVSLPNLESIHAFADMLEERQRTEPLEGARMDGQLEMFLEVMRTLENIFKEANS